MIPKFHIEIENKATGKRETVTNIEWLKIKNHPTIGRSMRKIKATPIPEAAIQAMRTALDEEE